MPVVEAVGFWYPWPQGPDPTREVSSHGESFCTWLRLQNSVPSTFRRRLNVTS